LRSTKTYPIQIQSRYAFSRHGIYIELNLC
jgi:hypothetical protein